MDRRTFVKLASLGAVGTAFGPSFWRSAYAAPAVPGPGPFGPLLAPDANGIQLPAGFTSRVLATSGQPVATPGGTLPVAPYVWHTFPDGGACFSTDDGGWVLTSNSEVPLVGGVGAIRFDRDGVAVDAYRILTGSNSNCAGGPTPWGTWLSCEEPLGPAAATGRVWETFPVKDAGGLVTPAVAYTAMGLFAHEAVGVDDERKQLYLTEDAPEGRFYRFTPTAYPDLSAGVLEAARIAADGQVTWVTVPNTPTSFGGYRGADTTAISGGEGIWVDAGFLYFTAKGENRVRALDLATQRIEVIYDAADPRYPEPKVLTGVDNVVGHPQSGDLFIAEDGGTMDIVLLTPERVVTQFLHIEGQDDSEICGPAFSPDGRRLYFSSQRGGPPGPGMGITYEVTGPFRTARPAAATPGAGAAPAGPGATSPGRASVGGGAQAPGAAPAAELPATGRAAALTGLGLGALGMGLLARRASSEGQR